MDQSRLLDAQGKTLPMAARAFAERCRTLDLGGQYQAYLKQQMLTPSVATLPAQAKCVFQVI